ncbi:MAG: DASH family cryptochrome [Bacteroidota bacterium]
MKRAIVWFRNDLRLQDHEVLHKVLNIAEEIIPVYCWDPRAWDKDSFDHVKTGPYRTRFLWESLQDLDASLKDHGNQLWVLLGKPEEVLPKIAKEYNVSSVLAHKQIGTEEADVELGVESQLFGLGINFELIWGRTLLHRGDLPMPIRAIPEVFTQFRKEVERSVEVRHVLPAPNKIPAINDPLPTLDWTLCQEYLSGPYSPSSKGVLPFKGGETAGKERLSEYLWSKDLLKVYKETRNGLLGADYSSKFSPWLALGCISPRAIYWEVKKYETERVKNDSTYWLIFELLWRDYFQFIAYKHGNKLFLEGGIRDRHLTVHENEDRWEAWKTGNTGVPFVDANMRELLHTGFMSNRGRQNVASFLVKDLGQDWRRGASYFEHMLIDYDVASNWGNWNYVAGVGNDPRKHRYFNVLSQGKRYDPKGRFIRHWVPELAELPSAIVHEPWENIGELKKYGITLGKDYPFTFRSAVGV